MNDMLEQQRASSASKTGKHTRAGKATRPAVQVLRDIPGMPTIARFKEGHQDAFTTNSDSIVNAQGAYVFRTIDKGTSPSRGTSDGNIWHKLGVTYNGEQLQQTIKVSRAKKGGFICKLSSRENTPFAEHLAEHLAERLPLASPDTDSEVRATKRQKV
jgi:hypothetical protein